MKPGDVFNVPRKVIAVLDEIECFTYASKTRLVIVDPSLREPTKMESNRPVFEETPWPYVPTRPIDFDKYPEYKVAYNRWSFISGHEYKVNEHWCTCKYFDATKDTLGQLVFLINLYF